MKNIFLSLALLLSMSIVSAQMLPPANAGVPLPLLAKPIKTGGLHTPLPKSPVQIPEVWQDGHTLYFDAAIEGCTLLLLDEDENVIFSHFIDENETSLTFPSTLTGTYELQIIRGSITFYCEIEL